VQSQTVKWCSMNLKLTCLAAVLVAVLFCPAAMSQEKDKIIFVSDLRDFSKNVSPEVLDLFTEIVRDGARRYATGYSLMDKENAQVILEGFGIDLQDCLMAGRDDCEVKFAERVQADIGVSGQILQLPEGGIRLVLKMHDVKKRSPINSTIKGAADINELERVLTESVVELYAPLYKPAGRDGVVGGGRETGSLRIDRGEKIVNRPTDTKGLVFIETNPPGADIQINGKPVGTSPYQASLMVGRYVVIAELNSYYHVARHEFELTSDGSTIELVLPPAFGEIEVSSTPSGAEVFVDDKPVGTTPYRDSQLLSGDHRIEVRKSMFKPIRRNVVVKDGQSIRESFALVEDFGGIKIGSEPSGAVITLDGKDTGKRTPALLRPVKEGTHILNLDLPGYGRVGDTVNVIAGRVIDVHKSLEAKYGTLAIMTRTAEGTPCRGNVAIDGEAKGKTPWKGQLLAVEHEISVECGARPTVERRTIEHNTSSEITITVAGGPPLRPVAVKRRKDNASSVGSVADKVSSAGADKMDLRRKRASFQARLSGGLDLYRASQGVGGLVQVGVGTGRWFDIHTGVGFPSYSWVTDLEVNLWPYGRFVPTLAARVGLGFHPDHNVYSIDFTAGVEMWMANWAAFFVKIGVGYSWNRTHDVSGVYVPGWLGLEFRY